MNENYYDNLSAYTFEPNDNFIDLEEWERYLMDDIHDEIMIQKYLETEDKIMERKIIKLSDLSSDEQIEKLVDYVWKGEYLIPAEMIEG